MHGLSGGAAAAQELKRLRVALGSTTIERVIADGLHEYLDQIQRNLIAVTSNVASDLFRRGPLVHQTQSQVTLPSGERPGFLVFGQTRSP